MNSFVVLLIFIFATYGFTNMIVYLNGPFGVFEKIRKIASKIGPRVEELFSCMACCSTWVGILFNILNTCIFISIPFTPGCLIFGTNFSIISLLIDTVFTSGTVWILHNLEESFERIGVYDDK